MERYSDEAIRILDDLHTERLDYHSEYLPLIDAAQRLDAYESTGMEPEDILNATDMAKVACALRELNQYKELGDLDRLRELVQADREGRCFITPFVAMVEQSLMNGEMKPERDQRFNGRYAVVYFDPEKWKVPLIDICGAPYNKEEAEQRAQQLIREAAEKALEKEENRNG